MKEHPILFSGPMVRAILEGRKTMTRRVVKNMPGIPLPGVNRIRLELHPFSKTALAGTPGEAIGGPDRLAWIAYDWIENAIGVEEAAWLRCPYGQPGDLLWVRETFAEAPDGSPIFRADPMFDGMGPGDFAWSWRPLIYMPRKLSRILLEVTAVRVERVQDISEEEARAEGAEAYGVPTGRISGEGSEEEIRSYRLGFALLWDSINARRGYGWDANPWVWVIEFRRVAA